MSKKLSYRGRLDIGTEQRITLRTMKGKVGYKITKFQLVSNTPGIGVQEFVGKITKIKDPNIGATVDFTDSNLMACAVQSTHSSNLLLTETVIFDNEITNQDIFVNITDAAGGTVQCNYFIELETMELSDVESTQLTLKSLRTIASQ
tara:strand:- start:536 stop:976 length:441 start_codon:yes stop_codon:yes gene_type:complete